MPNSKLRFFYPVAALTIALNFVACTKPDIDFGVNYLDNNNTNLVYLDTVSATISTVFLDSIGTSATGTAVLGSYTDPTFGKVTAESYFSISAPTYINQYQNAYYDSVVLILKSNKNYYGDTLQPMQILVQQLSQQIELGDSRTQFYNTSFFGVQPSVLGSKTFSVRPSIMDSVTIKLSDVLGQDLFGKLRSSDEIIQSQDKFAAYFKGLKLSGGNSLILGFQDSIYMRVYYHENGLFPNSQSVDFTLSDQTLQFNHITADRSGTPIAALNAVNNEILSTATGNASYLQSATGAVIKIQFPNIKDVLYIENFVKIMKAELVIRPSKNSFNDLYPLPPQLRLSETTQLNQFGNEITKLNTDSQEEVEYGDLVVDNLYGETTNYLYDITTYINNLLVTTGNTKNGLLLSAPSTSFSSSLNRLIAADNTNGKSGVQLRLYYLTVSK